MFAVCHGNHIDCLCNKQETELELTHLPKGYEVVEIEGDQIVGKCYLAESGLISANVE